MSAYAKMHQSQRQPAKGSQAARKQPTSVQATPEQKSSAPSPHRKN